MTPFRLALLLLAALALAGCAQPASDAPPADGEGAGDAAPPADGAAAPAPVEMQVVVGDGATGGATTLYTLSPATLELTAGVPVRLTLKNEGRGAHDLVIDGLDVRIESVPGGGTSEPVEFTPAEPGTFEMYCTLAGGSPLSHRDHGMRGEVVVR